MVELLEYTLQLIWQFAMQNDPLSSMIYPSL